MKKNLLNAIGTLTLVLVATLVIFVTSCNSDADSYKDYTGLVKELTQAPKVENFKVKAEKGVNILTWDEVPNSSGYVLYRKIGDGQKAAFTALNQSSSKVSNTTTKVYDRIDPTLTADWKSGTDVRYYIINTTDATNPAGKDMLNSEEVSVAVSVKDPGQIGDEIPYYEDSQKPENVNKQTGVAKGFELVTPKKIGEGSQLYYISTPAETYGATVTYTINAEKVGETQSFAYESESATNGTTRFKTINGIGVGPNDIYVTLSDPKSFYNSKTFKIGTINVPVADNNYTFNRGFSASNDTGTTVKLSWNPITWTEIRNGEEQREVEKTDVTYFLYYNRQGGSSDGEQYWTRVDMPSPDNMNSDGTYKKTVTVSYTKLDPYPNALNATSIEWKLFAVNNSTGELVDGGPLTTTSIVASNQGGNQDGSGSQGGNQGSGGSQGGGNQGSGQEQTESLNGWTVGGSFNDWSLRDLQEMQSDDEYSDDDQPVIYCYTFYATSTSEEFKVCSTDDFYTGVAYGNASLSVDGRPTKLTEADGEMTNATITGLTRNDQYKLMVWTQNSMIYAMVMSMEDLEF